MKKIKGSICAKIAAWIGITLSGILFIGSILGAVIMWELGAYENTRDGLKEQAFRSVCGQYSVMALNNWFNANQKMLDQPYFQYGIIKAEELDGLDLNQDSTYVARNFSEDVTLDDLYTNYYDIGEDTMFSYSGTLWDGYSVYNHTPTYLTSQYIFGTYYNEDDGIFYYDTPGDMFPVLRVDFGWANEDYSYEYDFERKMYRKLDLVETATATEDTVDRAESYTVSGIGKEKVVESSQAVPIITDSTTDETDTWQNNTKEVQETTSQNAGTDTSDSATTYLPEYEKILNQDYINFKALEDAMISPEEFDWLRLDGWDAWEFDGTEKLMRVEGSFFEGKAVTTERDYYPEDNILRINHTDESATDTYWVVSLIPEGVGTGWSSNLFVQANQIIDIVYGLRYGIYFIMLASLALGIFCFAFLISAAGHRKGTDEIQEAAIDILPFDIYLILAAFVEFLLLQLMVELSYHLDRVPEYILFGVLGVAIFLVALETVLTFAVRVKTKRWWRNTLICRVITWIGRGVRFFVENLPILGKAILLVAIVLFADLITLVLAADMGGIFILLWFVEKIVLAGVVFVAVVQMKKLQEGGEKIAEGDLTHQVDAEKMFWDFREHGENLNRISEGMSRAVDERMKSERFKTELITNVSHDIKTPLTSIINYVDLLEKEELHNENAEEYLEVLDRQSGRLKKLIEDLIEASKASSGSLPVHMEKLEAGVFMVQTVGEFEEKTRVNELELLIKKPEAPVYIMADGRHFWRVIDNLMNNICKYAQPSTRVYINMEVEDQHVSITFRNTSKYPLNITSEELMERFVRGDDSRNTEGSGLGISIAKSLTELMGGTFHLYVDGDLFKVELVFSVCV